MEIGKSIIFLRLGKYIHSDPLWEPPSSWQHTSIHKWSLPQVEPHDWTATFPPDWRNHGPCFYYSRDSFCFQPNSSEGKVGVLLRPRHYITVYKIIGVRGWSKKDPPPEYKIISKKMIWHKKILFLTVRGSIKALISRKISVFVKILVFLIFFVRWKREKNWIEIIWNIDRIDLRVCPNLREGTGACLA